MTGELVSIIIPCYRQAHFLPAALESVFAQTHSMIEVVVVNDGSDDETDAVARSYGGKITYVHKANGGLPSARNAGIWACRGRFLLFLDADDLLHPQAVEQLLRAANGRRDRLCLMGSRSFEDAAALDRFAPGVPEPNMTMFPGAIHKNIGPCHAVLCPTEVVKAVGGFEESLRACEDWDLWIRVGFAGLELAITPFVGAYYRQTPGSMSRDVGRMLEARARVLLRTHQHVMLHPHLVDTLGADLAEAFHRVHRRGLVQGLSTPLMESIHQTVRDLRCRGFQQRPSLPKRVLDRLLGDLSEKMILTYFRWFDARMYAFYQRNYY